MIWRKLTNAVAVEGSQENPITFDDSAIPTPSLRQLTMDGIVARLDDPQKWLNDTCIWAFVQCLLPRVPAGVHILDPLFFTQLARPERFESAAAWSKVHAYVYDERIMTDQHLRSWSPYSNLIGSS